MKRDWKLSQASTRLRARLSTTRLVALGIAASVAVAVAAGVGVVIATSGRPAAVMQRTDIPVAVHAPAGAAFQDFYNSNESDCDVAAAGNLIILWNANRHVVDTSVLEDVQHVWHELGHPSDGLIISTFLDWWSTHPIDGYRVTWLDTGTTSRSVVERDVSQFGAVDVSVQLSNAFLAGGLNHPDWTGTQTGPNQHQLDVVGYSSAGVEITSWGATYHATWQWFESHAIDVYVVVPVQRG